MSAQAWIIIYDDGGEGVPTYHRPTIAVCLVEDKARAVVKEINEWLVQMRAKFPSVVCDDYNNEALYLKWERATARRRKAILKAGTLYCIGELRDDIMDNNCGSVRTEQVYIL